MYKRRLLLIVYPRRKYFTIFLSENLHKIYFIKKTDWLFLNIYYKRNHNFSFFELLARIHISTLVFLLSIIFFICSYSSLPIPFLVNDHSQVISVYLFDKSAIWHLTCPSPILLLTWLMFNFIFYIVFTYFIFSIPYKLHFHGVYSTWLFTC